MITHKTTNGLTCRIATTEDEVSRLATEWHALYERVGINPLADYGPYAVWWKTVACGKRCKPHVVTGWREGRLVAVIPLAVRPRAGIRFLFMAGHNVFLGSMPLLENESDLEALWRTIRHSPHYDAAEINDVRPGSAIETILKPFPLAKCIRENISSLVRFDGQDGQAWAHGTLSASRRSKMRRKQKAMEGSDRLALQVYTQTVPDHLLDAMIGHKRAWCHSCGLDSCIVRGNAFLKELVKDAATRGALRFLCLSLGDKAIGFCLCLIKGKDVTDYLIAHDPAYDRFSVGFLTNVMACQWAADNGFETFDFMQGQEVFKATLANVRTTIRSYAFCRTIPGVLGWLALCIAARKCLFSPWGNETGKEKKT